MNTGQYHKGYQALHWITALLVLGLLFAGFYMTSMEFSPLKLDIYMVHKSLGMSVLGLVIIRILWRAFVSPPPPLESHQKWEKALSKTIHLLLYFALIAMPMSGWVMSSAGEYPVNYFGLFEIPALTGKDERLFELTREVHEIGGFALIAAVGLHFLGAAKHHIIDKDATLRRMGGNISFLALGGVLLLTATLAAAPHIFKNLQEPLTSEQNQNIAQTVQTAKAVHDESPWTILKDESDIRFTFQQYGQPVNGAFNNFDGTIIFDPDNLDIARAEIEIDISSITTGSADRDQQALSDEWFAAEEYPMAIFTSESFSESSDNSYEVEGVFTLRGQSVPISFPFSLEFSENSEGEKIATMQASLSLKRLDFGVGQGQWEKAETIDNIVEINITLTALKT